jgi:hypothetical protein
VIPVDKLLNEIGWNPLNNIMKCGQNGWMLAIAYNIIINYYILSSTTVYGAIVELLLANP